MIKSGLKIVIRGGGELASGIAHRLFSSHFTVTLTEIENPLAIRREVSFSEAVFDGIKTVEGVTAQLATSSLHAQQVWESGMIPILIDPANKSIKQLQPDIVIDAIMAKKNLGTSRADAHLVIGIGPGFLAGEDVHAVIETNRGHNLGKVIYNGVAEKDTGIPGKLGDFSIERLIRAPCEGKITGNKKIGDRVKAGDLIATINTAAVVSLIDGIVRGLLRDGSTVTRGMKIGDIDPRGIREYCYTISDKARAIAGGVLEAILAHFDR